MSRAMNIAGLCFGKIGRTRKAKEPSPAQGLRIRCKKLHEEQFKLSSLKEYLNVLNRLLSFSS